MVESRASGTSREHSGDISLADSRFARRIFFRPRWEPVRRLKQTNVAGYSLLYLTVFSYDH